ncbi:MAG TPA: class I tRNA ligase family protein, partial [Acidimicrobiia bacterium]
VPDYMGVRFKHWVDGLNGDWLISRQRFFGVAIPLWYPLDEDGRADYSNPIIPDDGQLPIDPSSHVPAGFEESQRNQPGGFIGDPDIMDTWATSSLTPQIVGHWDDDPDLWNRVFPMDIRPQGPDIIRTWLFATTLRSHLEHDVLPWHTTTINGWILDPDRKKMSKSKGNVVTPRQFIDDYSAEGVRYWAASGRPGTDTALDEGQFKIGRRLAIKILNAAKFALGFSDEDVDPSAITEPLDMAMLAQLAETVAGATAAFEAYDYARALEIAERSFWNWTDDYVELVKARAYEGGAPAESAHAALQLALSVYLRLFAPFLPFVTEEAWSWWKEGSVHRASWPSADEFRGVIGEPGILDAVSSILGEVRRAKSDAKTSMRTEVELVEVTADAGTVGLARQAEGDLIAAARAEAITYEDGEFAVVARLAQDSSS